MPKNLEELATLISTRDNIGYAAAMSMIHTAAMDMEHAFYNGDLDLAEDILRTDLGLEPDYLDLFIF